MAISRKRRTKKKSDLKKLAKRIEKELSIAKKQIDKLEQEEFTDKSLIELKIKEIIEKLKYHQTLEWEINEINRGKTNVDRVKCKLTENQELITQQENACGRFILATNILDTQELEPEEILKIYKEQQSAERGFRFIKDPLFFADSLFVKNPERVETMMMLMALCLLVYNLGQRQLRRSLKAQKATINNQLNKPTESPTLRWVLLSQCVGRVSRLEATGVCFQGIHLLITQGCQRVLNFMESHYYILQFLPNACRKYYLLS